MNSPIGTPASEASQRRAMESTEYRQMQEEYAPVREIARQLVLFRTRNAMTQQQLAELAGTSHSQVSRLESGRHKPSLDTLQRIAQAMGLRVHVTFEPVSEGVDGTGSLEPSTRRAAGSR